MTAVTGVIGSRLLPQATRVFLPRNYAETRRCFLGLGGDSDGVFFSVTQRLSASLSGQQDASRVILPRKDAETRRCFSGLGGDSSDAFLCVAQRLSAPLSGQQYATRLVRRGITQKHADVVRG